VDTHKNAPMTPAGRLRMVHAVSGGESTREVARRLSVDPKTVRKWCRRFAEGGESALADRSSRPHRCPSAIPRGTLQRAVKLRRQGMMMAAIAAELSISKATVARVMKREGLSRLSALQPAPLPRRYEREAPGELLHIDIKRLGGIRGPGHRVTGDRSRRARGAGWDVTFVAIDDHSRVAFAQVWPAENAHSAAGFLQQTLAYYRTLGIRVQRILTDNGKVFGSGPFTSICTRFAIKRMTTRPYRPQTNGKAERFIQTAMREWAYGRTYRHSRERSAHLPRWLHHYNWHRPHSSLGGFPPISRLPLTGGNLLSLHS
jgi:transposase InsO family protein